MPRLATGRRGKRLLVLQRPLEFSFWPMYRTTRRFGLQSTLFAQDPWTIIVSSIARRCPVNARSEATASVEQALDFYNAANQAKITAARPLLLYYCFLNLGKAYALTVGKRDTYDQAQHGLSALIATGGKELIDAYLDAYKSPSTKGIVNMFDEVMQAVGGSGMAVNRSFQLKHLMPQIVPGHRLWADAANVAERFIALHDVRFYEGRSNRQIWLRLHLFADDLSRLGVSHKRLLDESGLSASFREVKTNRKVAGRKLLCLEQIHPRTYTDRPSDVVPELVNDVRRLLWTTVASIPPYRRYYLYLTPMAERPEVLPQLLSIYAITYYLGSITRYRPHHFDVILQGEFGPRMEEFISGQPLQFIYLMASEFAEQEVTKPSIV